MPSIDQAKVLMQKGVPYAVAANTDPVTAPSAITSSASVIALTAASVQPVATDLPTAIALVNELRTQIAAEVAISTEYKTKYNQAQTDVTNVRTALNNLITALKKNGTVL